MPLSIADQQKRDARHRGLFSCTIIVPSNYSTRRGCTKQFGDIAVKVGVSRESLFQNSAPSKSGLAFSRRCASQGGLPDCVAPKLLKICPLSLCLKPLVARHSFQHNPDTFLLRAITSRLHSALRISRPLLFCNTLNKTFYYPPNSGAIPASPPSQSR